MDCRLLYVIGELHAGGSERQLYLLLKSMDRRRFHPQVVVWNFSDYQRYASLIRELDIPIYGFPETFSTATKIRRLHGLVAELNPEVLHSYSFYLNVAAHCATLRTNTIAIGSVRSDFIGDIQQSGLLIGSLSARWPRNQICNSFSAMHLAKQSGGPFTPGQLFVVRNGLELKEVGWSPIPSGERVSFLGIGSLVPVKRWDRLLEAASELKKLGLDFLLRIAGEGPLRRALTEQARKLGLCNYIDFMGHCDDIPKLLADSTFLAHTSDAEGCPNVVMEAMASGRPVVAMDAGDAAYMVEEGKTGFLIRRGDSKTLVECLATLIADPSLCQRMGEAGRAKAMREFGLDRLVGETMMAYKAMGWRSEA